MVEGPSRTRFAIGNIGFRARPIASSAAAAALAAGLLLVGAAPPRTMGLLSQAHAQAVSKPVGFADIVARVKPAVISVRVRIATGRRAKDGSTESPLDRFFRRFGAPDDQPNPRGRGVVTGQGSGFFVSADGYAVTNFHVVDRSETVEVTTDDGRVFPAKVIGADQRSDIALIKVDGAGTLPFVRFSETTPRIGDWVIAVGNPFGLGGTVTAGIVSANGRDIGAGPYDDFIQIDAAVNRGNSGGPTFDVDGNVIGVNAAIVSPSGGSVGIAFAIPAETAKAVITQLKDKGKVTRGWIGVQIQDVTPDIADGLGLGASRGALVAEPQPDGPAGRAGIESGDVVVGVNGKEIGDSRELARLVSSMSPGASVTLAVVHRGQERSVNVTLGNLPDQREASAAPEVPKQRGTSLARLGLSVAPHTGGNGIVVTAVDPDGIAAEQGFQAGDVIVQVAGKKVGNVGDLRSAVEAAERAGKRTVLMRVKTGDGIRFVAMPVGRV
jgi:serine protease Do